MSIVRIEKGDLQIGKPVPWALYDENNTLLLTKGVILRSQKQLDQLVDKGLFRKEAASDAAGDKAQGSDQKSQLPEDIRPLEQVKIGIGDTIQLQSINPDSKGARYYVKLIGYVKSKSLLVTTPVVNGSALLMREGQGFIVRLFSGKSVYAFTSHIIRPVNLPFPYLHLTYPQSVKGMVVRKGSRANVNLACTVTNAEGITLNAVIANISTGGALLVCRDEICERNAEIVVKFTAAVDGIEQPLHIRSIVRSINTIDDIEGKEGQFGHGLQFVEIPQKEQVALSAFVYQRLFEESA